MAIIVLLVSVILLGLGAFVLAGNKDISSWIQFYARGKDAGFSFHEIGLMRKAAIKAELEEPIALFWSLKQLNECIKGISVRAKLTGQDQHNDTQVFLSKLYDFRKKLEFDQPRYRKGIQSSRQISEKQILRVLLEGEGVFKSKVLRNSDRHITITLPESVTGKTGVEWRGKKISVYFWRIDDAGYVFDSFVYDEVKSTGWPAIQVAHSDSLFRTQKRKSIRARTSIPAYLYIVTADDDPNRLETEPGYRCIVEDLSEDGCAVTIGGKARDGLTVRIQFELAGETLAMCGIVKSSDYKNDSKRSLLHIESFPLPVHVKNRIQAEVFGIQTVEEMEETFSFFNEEEGAVHDLEAKDSPESGSEQNGESSESPIDTGSKEPVLPKVETPSPLQGNNKSVEGSIIV